MLGVNWWVWCEIGELVVVVLFVGGGVNVVIVKVVNFVFIVNFI